MSVYEEKFSGPQIIQNQREELPFLQFLTIKPVGNPLPKLNPVQREFFFESLTRHIADSWAESQRKARKLKSVPVMVRAHDSAYHMQKEKEQAKKEELMKAVFEKPIGLSQDYPAAIHSGKSGQAAFAAKAAESPAMPAQLQHFYSVLAFKETQESLVHVLEDYARGDLEKLRAAVSDFEGRLKSQDYAAHDLMSVVLLVIEDHIWEGSEGAPGSASHFGSRVRPNPAVPEILRTTAMNSAMVRLASVREMLRYYFERHPKEYSAALAAALGITTDKEGDMVYLQERLACELARIGSFALSQKILAAIKEKKRMDTEHCLLELGYKYDRKRRVLVLGKRTCGSRNEARGIIGLLLAIAKK